ncbi:MAG: hypothetical protein O3A75_00585 [Verrucomicrobia bacterium]|nr:hypothetical protein [Verrucomicrobiota bacterium]MDA1202792.1 hypothetical protein [Verrucomicrobiota bacterium]
MTAGTKSVTPSVTASTRHRLGHIDHRNHDQRSIRGVSSSLQDIAPDHGGERCVGPATLRNSRTRSRISSIKLLGHEAPAMIEGDWC